MWVCFPKSSHWHGLVTCFPSSLCRFNSIAEYSVISVLVILIGPRKMRKQVFRHMWTAKAQKRLRCITKTYLYNFDPLKPHFYILNLGFTGIYIIFLISAQKHILWVLVRTVPPRQGGSNEYPQSMFWVEIRKISEFLSENFQVWWWNFQNICIGVFS